ncbi:MAG: response regulator transcription factor [Coriobacteriia bacterium]|nr:response regulator transcription factor [Coriobacteriia bacterium]
MVRVVLADDHEMVRAGFRMLLETDPEFQVVGEAAEGTQAYAVVSREKPDVLMLDISMPPGQSGMVACEEIARDMPQVKIIIVTMFAEPEYLDYTMRSGASGYLLKSASAEELHDAVRTVVGGGMYVHPKMKPIMERYLAESGSSDELLSLTPRELEILQLLAKGFTNREISERVYLSVKTVEAHRSKIYAKLHLKSRAELVDFAMKHKLLNV